MNARFYVLPFLVALATACSPGGGSLDAGTDSAADGSPADAPAQCRTDNDCTDGVFCDGAELCAPGDPSADARGCVAPSQRACRPTQTCDESNRHCITDCSANPDADGDGHRARECGGDDCDDADFNRAPGRTEVCDALDRDEDCDPTTFGSRDDDADGFTDALCCNTDDSGNRHCGTDCNDMSARIRPDAQESCNGADDNCNGQTDEGLSHSYHPDADGDRFGASAGAAVTACAPPAGYVEDSSDCDDANPAANPGAPEVCDGIDNDCDGMTDEGLARTYHPDADGDQFGNPDPALAMTACRAPAGYVENASDCNDTQAAAHPGVMEVCDGVDNDCDGTTDAGLTRTFYVDLDGDGYGQVEGGSVDACGPPAGYVATSDDCDDTAPQIHPGAPEVCNGFDDNCNLEVDETQSSSLCAAGYDCIAGACTPSFSACTSSTADCDGNQANGCETNVTADVNNCGTCGLACGLGGTCTAGACDAPVAVAAGRAHTCAARSNGLVVCWGDNAYAQHGAGGATGVGPGATVVAGVRGAVQVAAGQDFTCARTGDGAVWCWGRDDAHQLGGAGAGTPSATPLRVVGITDAVDVAAGDRFACAVRRTGEVVCWGANDRGQLGGGAVGTFALPVTARVSGARSVAAGGAFACVATGSASLLCWGDNASGQQGTNADPNPHPTPATVAGLPGVVAIAAGAAHVCARMDDGNTWCWGANDQGQLGVNATSPTQPPTALTSAPHFDLLALGGASSAGVSGANLYTWGDNGAGQLAQPTGSPVTSPSGVSSLYYGVLGVSLGVDHGCATTSAGTVECWGSNSAGQIGEAPVSSSNYPVTVDSVSNTMASGGPA